VHNKAGKVTSKNGVDAVYPLRTPSTRFMTKKEPMIMRLTK